MTPSKTYLSMKNKKVLTTYEKAVIERTREARAKTTLVQDQMAERLGIPRATYAKYETDRIMDYELIPSFCSITDISIDFLFTGRNHSVVDAYYRLEGISKAIVDRELFGEKKPDPPLKTQEFCESRPEYAETGKIIA